MYEFFYYCAEAEEHLRYALIHSDLAKVELLGENYVFELANEHIKRFTRDIYVTDALRSIAILAAALGRQRFDMPRYYDWINYVEPEPEQSPTEIKAEIFAEYYRITG